MLWNVREKNTNNIRSRRLQTHNIISISSLLFHHISYQHYLLPHFLFHILNSSQWLGAFLWKMVRISPKFIYYFLNLIILCIVFSQLHILWIVKIVIENYEWKIITQNPPKKKKIEPHRMREARVLRLYYFIVLVAVVVIYYNRYIILLCWKLK